MPRLAIRLSLTFYREIDGSKECDLNVEVFFAIENGCSEEV